MYRGDLTTHYASSDLTEIWLAVPFKSLTLRVDENDEHHRDESFDGIGDVRFGAKHFFHHSDVLQVAGIVGLAFPTGDLNKVTAASYLSHDEADALGVTVPEHSHLQLGTGTFDPLIGVEALYRFGDHWLVFGSLSMDIPLYANRFGYRTSPSGTLNLGPAVRVTEARLIASLFVEGFYSGRDRFEGDDIHGPGGSFDGKFLLPNTGRFELALTPGVTWGVTGDVTLNLQARFPLYTRIREDPEKRDVQLSEYAGMFATLSYNF